MIAPLYSPNGLSVEHFVGPFQRAEGQHAPVFLPVKAGMTVICGYSDPDEWWMADVIHVDRGSRDPKVPTLFQVADVDTGVARWACAHLVTYVVPRV